MQNQIHGDRCGGVTLSHDLIHWKQKDHALYPDEMGASFLVQRSWIITTAQDLVKMQLPFIPQQI